MNTSAFASDALLSKDRLGVPTQMPPFGVYANTCSVPSEDRLNFWNYLNQPAYSLWPIDGDASNFCASIACWRAGKVVFSHVAIKPGDGSAYLCRLERIPRKVLMIRAFIQSDECGLIGNEAVVSLPGEVHLYPYGQKSRLITRHIEHVTAYVPFEMLGYNHTGAPRQTRLEAGSPSAKLLGNMLVATLDNIGRGTHEDAAPLGQSFAGLAGSLIGDVRKNCSGHEVFERARGAALRSFILERLYDSELTIDRICSAFGASRATIYREFEREGGIGRYIRIHRLHRAMLDLTMTGRERGGISEIATRYGYREASTFTRAFRRHFGALPSDYLGSEADRDQPCTATSNQAYSAPIALIDRWLSA